MTGITTLLSGQAYVGTAPTPMAGSRLNLGKRHWMPAGLQRRYDGKTVLVTGGGQGIGRSMAERVGAEGARVVLFDIDDDALARAVEFFASQGWPVAAVTGDVSQRDDVRRAIDVSVQRFGGIDVLFAVAGIGEIRPFLQVSEASWTRILSVNLSGMFIAAQEAARSMAEKSTAGAIVLTASTNATFPEANTVPYSVSKAGVVGLTRAAALDLAPLGIRINCISPGQIVTRMSAVLVDDPVAGPAVLQKIPLGRWGQPKEIAAAAAFLGSDDASYMTGENVTVDAGMTVGTVLGIEEADLGAARTSSDDANSEQTVDAEMQRPPPSNERSRSVAPTEPRVGDLQLGERHVQ